jgi:hypothetical protein
MEVKKTFYFFNPLKMTLFYDPKSKKNIQRSWSTKEDIEKMWKEARENGWVYYCMHYITRETEEGEEPEEKNS